MESLTPQQENARKKEKGYIIARSAGLMLLALGTSIAMYRLGGQIAQDVFPGVWIASFLTKAFLIGLSFFGIDFVAQNALSSASDITSLANVVVSNEDGELSRTVNKGLGNQILIFGGLALVATITISGFANSFVSNDLAGESQISRITSQIENYVRQDSINKNNAFLAINTASEQETAKVKSAKNEAKALLSIAVEATNSKEWKEDYLEAKDNLSAWFWVCQQCPRKYRQYRDGIKKAMDEGNTLLSEARNHSSSVQATVAPTLSYEMQSDTTLKMYIASINAQEQQREGKAAKIFWLLMIFTMVCGITVFGITLMLKEHRKAFGQYIVEDLVSPIEYFFDMVSNTIVALRDVCYTLFSLPYRKLTAKNWILTYQISQPETTSMLTIHHGRRCSNCRNSIDHKRTNAKFCDDDCKNEYHGRGGKAREAV
jgi:hypothetical protein